MSKVTPLFINGQVKEILSEAQELNLTEVVLVAKQANGLFWVRISACNAIQQIGMIELVKQELLDAIKEEPCE